MEVLIWFDTAAETAAEETSAELHKSTRCDGTDMFVKYGLYSDLKAAVDPKFSPNYYVDIPGHQVLRLDPVTRALKRWQMSSEPGCIALIEGGGLLVAQRNGLWRVTSQNRSRRSELAIRGFPERPSDDRVNAFARILADRNVTVSVRKSRGRDIRAACGQLIVECGRAQSAAQALAAELA